MNFSLPVPSKLMIIDGVIILANMLLILWCLFFSRNKRAKYISIIVNGGIAVLFSFLLLTALQTKVIVTDNYIKLNIPPYSRETIYKEDIVRAFVVDIDADNAQKPAAKRNGTGIGSYRVGHYRLSNGSKAVLMINSNKVLCIQLKDKYIMLSPSGLDEFINQINSKMAIVEQ